jgi:hypothetical protein
LLHNLLNALLFLEAVYGIDTCGYYLNPIDDAIDLHKTLRGKIESQNRVSFGTTLRKGALHLVYHQA